MTKKLVAIAAVAAACVTGCASRDAPVRQVAAAALPPAPTVATWFEEPLDRGAPRGGARGGKAAGAAPPRAPPFAPGFEGRWARARPGRAAPADEGEPLVSRAARRAVLVVSRDEAAGTRWFLRELLDCL